MVFVAYPSSFIAPMPATNSVLPSGWQLGEHNIWGALPLIRADAMMDVVQLLLQSVLDACTR
jgi:hypothetical protein